MIQMELQEENSENILLTYIWNIHLLPLDKFASKIPTNTIIDLFNIILCMLLHFQHFL